MSDEQLDQDLAHSARITHKNDFAALIDPLDEAGGIDQATTFKDKLQHFNYISNNNDKAIIMAPPTRRGIAANSRAPDTHEPQSRESSSKPQASPSSETPENTTSSSKPPKRKALSLPSPIKAKPKKPRITSKPTTTTTPSTPALNHLRDSLRPGLILVSIGLNPGIQTGATGHAYAHASNRYWPTLHLSGITPIRHLPSATHTLMDAYGLGHTNIIADKATVGGKDLTREDYMAGAAALERKIRACRPQAVMVVGKGVWEEWVRYKTGKTPKKGEFEYGWQEERLWIGREDGEGGWEGARTAVVTTTSGMSSTHSTEERVKIWRPVGEWFEPRREEWVRRRAEQKGGGEGIGQDEIEDE